MLSTIGNKIKCTFFGESHGRCIGGVIENIKPGLKIDSYELWHFMKRRRPGGKNSTLRKETDEPIFLSGIKDSVTTGFPIAFEIKNKDHHSTDYKNLKKVPRPSHADFTAEIKYKGFADMNGGGHFSARLTAAICVAGFIARKELEEEGINIYARLKKVHQIEDDEISYDQKEPWDTLKDKEIAMVNDEKIQKIETLIERLRDEMDSVGGVVECVVQGIKAGYGGPLFDGVEGKLSLYLFGIPGVKGIEFGTGFKSTDLFGSEHNDPFIIKEGKVVTKTNHAGGILGGITSGMPLVLRLALKPTASISKEQQSVNLDTKKEETLVIRGRHDPCIAIRAVPIVEAVTALGILDLMRE